VPGPSANLAFVLGGATPGSGFGLLQFANPLALAGTFTASTRNGFRPNPADTFHVLTYPPSTNTFACINGLDLGGGLMLQPHFSPTGLTFTVAAYTLSSQPQLLLARTGSNLVIQWPDGFPNWTLQSTTNLSTSLWAPVPATCGNGAFVPGIGRGEQWFRMKKN
jgi:hypothetical protein